jgi:2-polyprenyl-6-methoxyphenol hydroxylase-like FAD-dependent oxidoreductase
MADSQVLIVGAGPTGLVMALSLARLGVSFRIIDKHSGPGQTSRAMVIQARTLEFYGQLGLAEEVAQAGIKVEQLRLREGSREMAVLRFGDFGKGLSPYPFVLSFPQDEHERLLEEKLRALGVEVEWNTELAAITAGNERVAATIRRQGEHESCEVSYLCGCDGVHSTVRENLKLEFPGGIYRQMFFVADVSAPGVAVNGDINFFLGANQLCLVFPIRTSGMVRVIGIVPSELSGRENLGFEDLRASLQKFAALRVDGVNWFSTYHVHHRVANRFRLGRIFLAGDAGHVHSPAGGQGMNTGIGDAVNLSWKLAEVLKGKADAAILDTYEIERRSFALKLVSTTDRLFRIAVQQSIPGEIVRTMLLPHLLPWLMGFSAIQKAQFRLVSQTRINYRQSPLSEGNEGALHGGDRLPWVDIDQEGNFAPLKSLTWQIHVYGKATEDLRQAAVRHGLALHEYPWNQRTQEVGLTRDALYLLRPDGHIALLDSTPDVDRLQHFLSRFRLEF